MLQSENEDYDDEINRQRFEPKNVRYLRRAGNCWIFVWVWFLIGICWFLGKDAIRVNFRIGQILFVSFHVVLAGIFLWGGYRIRQGKVKTLWLVTAGSIFLGIFYGGCGLLVGSMMATGFMEDFEPDYTARIEGVLLSIWTGLGILWILVAIFFTIWFSIKDKRIDSPQFQGEPPHGTK